MTIVKTHKSEIESMKQKKSDTYTQTIPRDIHIKILQWANTKGKFTLEEIFVEFPEYKEFIQRQIAFSHLFVLIPEQKVYFLTFEDKFRLLEYEELQEARKSSKQALIVAIISILLTGVALVFSICH